MSSIPTMQAWAGRDGRLSSIFPSIWLPEALYWGIRFSSKREDYTVSIAA